MRTLAAFGLILVLAAPALADLGTVYARHTSVGPGVIMKIWGRTYQGLGNVQTGVYNHQIDYEHDATTGKGKDVSEWGFCIEMQNSANGWLTYDVLSLYNAPVDQGPGGNPMGATKAAYLEELWAEVDSLVGVNKSMTNTQAAAFQAAVWEIVYEDSPTGTSTYGVGQWNVQVHDTNNTINSFKIEGNNNTVENQANAWLALVDGSSPSLAKPLAAISYWSENQNYQDFLVQIPAPGAALLGLIGLGLVGKVMRRFA